MVETLFQAYFLEGADLTSEPVLLDLAQRAGMDPQRVHACLHDEGMRTSVLDEDRMARELGVEGVPFFVFNRRLAVSGAQEPDVLLRAIDRAARQGAKIPV
jgi:predicted DsbA family dithiol-disulfide isomerase